jgi:peptide deformylase
MSHFQVLTIPDPRLRQVAAPVTKVDDEVRLLLDQMLEAMYEEDGGGLAAPQIGILKRIVVMDVEEDDSKNPIFMVNPKITWASENKIWKREACLSVPGVSAEILRSEEVEVEYIDYHNMPQTLKAGGWKGRCIQHELDHLEGKLYIDHLSPLKRQLILGKLKRVNRIRAHA